MVNDFDAEKCKQCTMKHLSTAVAVLRDDGLPDMLRRVYFCGNLSHAANHLVHLDEQLAEDVRGVRIDAQDDGLNFKLTPEEITQRLMAIIDDVSKLEVKVPEPVEAKAATPETGSTPVVEQPAQQAAPVQKRGCPCHAER